MFCLFKILHWTFSKILTANAKSFYQLSYQTWQHEAYSCIIINWKKTYQSVFCLSLLLIISIAPARPTVQKTTDISVVIAFTKLADASHTYTYHAEAKTIGGDIHQSDCDGGTSTCILTGLTPASSYEMRVRTCFSPVSGGTICGAPSLPAIAWTLQKG